MASLVDHADYGEITIFSVNCRCLAKMFGRVHANHLFALTGLTIMWNGNTAESSILEEKLKSLKLVNIIWLNLSRTCHRVVFLIWD